MSRLEKSFLLLMALMLMAALLVLGVLAVRVDRVASEGLGKASDPETTLLVTDGEASDSTDGEETSDGIGNNQ